MKYLLDTCVISETARPRPHEMVMSWLLSVDEQDLFVPAVVLGELRKGIELCEEGRRKQTLSAWLDECHRQYEDRIVNFDRGVADLWGTIVAELQRHGRTSPVIDSQIAATALRHGMTLVTRNVRDMAGFGVDLFNPFA